jgi:hypothetical protein
LGLGPVAERVAAEFGVDDAVLQLRIEPIASTGIDELVAWVGPTVQRYLTSPTAFGSGTSLSPTAN